MPLPLAPMNVLIAPIALVAQWGYLWGPPPVDPHSHHSPDGTLHLHVESIQRNGNGPGIYSMFRGNERLWHLEAPFHLTDVFVSEDGQSFGCGDVAPGDRDWEMVVALFSADGELLNDERTTKAMSRYPHGPSNPLPLGLVPDPDHDRIWVRIADPDINAAVESWWGYRLSTGERLDTIQPAKALSQALGFKGRRQSLRQATVVPGTDLVLVHWWLANGRDDGGLFALLNAKGELVWKLDLPSDYAVPPKNGGKEAAGERLRFLRGQELILNVSVAGQFEVAHVKAKERVTFGANRTSGTWHVKELARAPWTPGEPPGPSAAGPERATLKLRLESTTKLQGVRLGQATSTQEVDPQLLYEFGPASALGNGRISLQDLRTGALHSWNEAGERLATGLLPQGQRERLKSDDVLLPGANGETWAQLEYETSSGADDEEQEVGASDPWVRWDADGTYLGRSGAGISTGLACAEPLTWTWDPMEGARILDRTGAEVGRIEQVPDKSWIHSIMGVSMAPDGRAWVWEGVRGSGREGDPFTGRVLVTGEDLKVEEVWPLVMGTKPIDFHEPQHRGPWILASQYQPLLLTSEGNGTWKIWEPADLSLEGGPKGELKFGFSADGAALLVVDEQLTLRRYGLPDPCKE